MAWQLQKGYKDKRNSLALSTIYLHFFLDLQQLVQMNSRVSLAIMLICLLLSDAAHGVNWQGTGSGTNNTVLTEIWAGLESNLNAALTTNTQNGYNAFTKQISDRLNTRWEKAWNVVLIKSQTQSDSILYGYAFRNQWMWFNGLPNNVLGTSSIATLIVWKDYNCQSWKYIGEESTAFNSDQQTNIQSVVDTITYSDINNNIWGAAFKLIKGMESYFLGAYTVIMSQDPTPSYYGRVCRVGARFYERKVVLTQVTEVSPGFFASTGYGSFHMFQTR